MFNNSYRKVILNDDYSKFNEYEINLEYIEEMMTEKLLKNKKLINDEIFELKYKNEDLEFENKNICTKFKKTFNLEDLSINDKILFYEYFKENKGNVKLHLNLLDEFAYLIKYSTENIDKIKEPSQTKIDKYLEEIEYISKDFKEIFKDKKNLTLTKLLNIYEYYQILCFNKVKEELKQYQEKITDKEQKNLIENYVKIDLQKNEKIKNNLEVALRKFILCFLAKEKKREDKIKRNKNNIKNYLEIEDLWNGDFYKKNEFYQELKKLQTLGIKINIVIPFYDKCFNNIYKNYFDDVKAELKEREEEKKRKEEEKEKEDLRNFNTQDVGVNETQNEPEENTNEENVNKDNNDNNDNENVEDEDNGDSYIDEGVDEENEEGGRY